MRYCIVVLFVAIIIFSSCKKKEIEINERSSDLEEAYLILSQVYYWNENLKPLSKLNLKSIISIPDLMLNLRNYSPINEVTNERIDRWSFVLSEKDWKSVLNGVKNDVGISLRFVNDGEARISLVQPLSQAALSGLRRGMKVYKVNGIDANTKNVDLLINELNNGLSFNIQIDDETSILEFNFDRKAYQASDILKDSIYKVNNKSIGYLVYNSFTNNSIHDLRNILENYGSQSIDEIIVDLRYNGGGLVSTMEDFANLLAPPQAKGKIMYTDRHNKEYSIFDSKTFFDGTESILNVNRIVFIIGKNTASASEQLINSLKPYIDVVTVGQTSDGKPYGMYIFNINNTILSPISFESFNANGENSSYLGILPEIASYEDIQHDLGDTNEKCLNDALGFITGKLATETIYQSTRKIDWDNDISISNSIIGSFKTTNIPGIKNK